MLEIDLSAMIVTVIVFLGLIYFLNKKLYVPLLSFMDAREAAVRKDEESAKQNADDVSINKAQIEKILNDARVEASKIRQSSLEAAKKKADEEIAEKMSQMDMEFDKFFKELNEQKSELKAKLREKIPEFKTSLKNTFAKI